MAAETLIFDPDGDLVLILSRIPRDDSESDSSSEVDSISFSTESGIRENVEEENDETQGDVVLQPESNIVDEANQVQSTFDYSPDLLIYASHKEETSQEEGPDTLVHMLVSSKHMMLASPVFKTMLQTSSFEEGRKLNAAGKVEVPFPKDDPTAFEVVLNVIHGRNKLVPRVISLQFLTSVTLLVDKYQMVEAVECFSDTWIGALIKDLPQAYAPGVESLDVLRWLQVSWVFENNEVFKEMTRLLELGCTANIKMYRHEQRLIPDLIFDSILKKRQEALSELYNLIEKTIQRYQRPRIRCPRQDDTELRKHCDSLILGSLLKSSKKLRIIPVPSSPYGVMSFDRLKTKLYSLDINAICDSISRPRIDGAFPKPAHGLKDLIQRKIESLEEGLSGLDIQDFKRKWKSSRPLVGV